MRLIPDAWMPPASMKRIIMHWTAGRYAASGLDRAHYHFLIEGPSPTDPAAEGRVVRGQHAVSANERAGAAGTYAAHTRGTNSGSIGISMCCMANARSASDAGVCPMTPRQFDMLCRAAAELAERYAIPVTRPTVLHHGEVQEVLGITQSGKWDALALPFDPGLSPRAVGDLSRARIQEHLSSLQGGGGTAAPRYRVANLPPGDMLNVRIAPGATGVAAIATLEAGRIVELLAADGRWRHILWTDEASGTNRRGWVHGNYLERHAEG